MLCAKNLKVALAAILGVVGLVSAGTAHAAINLNPPQTGGTPNEPQYFAAEKLRADTATSSAAVRRATTVVLMASSTTGGFGVEVPALPVGFLAGETYFLRFELVDGSAATGSNDATKVAFNAATAFAAGATLELRDAGETNNPMISGAVASRVGTLADDVGVIFSATGIGAQPAGDLNVIWNLPLDAIKAGIATPTTKASYSLRMSIWESRSDAREGDVGAGTKALWVGGNIIVRTEPTITTRIANKLDDVTASVATQFRRFVPNDPTTDTKGRLATVTVGFAGTYTENRGTPDAVTRTILDHKDAGTAVVAADVLTHVQVKATGSNDTASYNFGEFYLDADCAGTDAMTRVVPEDTPDTADKVQITTELTRNVGVGTHHFCANVTANTDDQMRTNADGTKEPYEKYKVIEDVSYTLTLATKLVDIAELQDSKSSGPGGGGTIVRDGTIVRIAYLTTASSFGAAREWQGGGMGGYNQRLVMVNHGGTDARYELGQFASEEGVTAMATDMATGTLEANSTLVLPVRDLITIEGGARTSGKVTLVAQENNVSVATVQVTLPEGQTDTVNYHPR